MLCDGWCDELVATFEDLDQAIKHAELYFESHEPPFHIYVKDKDGNIIFYKEK